MLNVKNGESALVDFSEEFLENLTYDLNRAGLLDSEYCDCERVGTEWLVLESIADENFNVVVTFDLRWAENLTIQSR